MPPSVETTDLLPVLNETEREELATCEAVIARGRQAFLEVGNALLKIRDGRLYRDTHGTFAEYLLERWDIRRSRGYQLMEAAAVVNGMSNMLDIPLPQNDRQALALGAMPSDDRGAVWREAVKTAPNGKMTAAHVEATALRMIAAVMAEEEVPSLPQPEKPAAAETVKPDPNHPYMKVTEVIEHLKALAQPPLTAAEFREITTQPLASWGRAEAEALAPGVRAFLLAITRDEP